MVKQAFLFPGQGAQYPGMGKDLYQSYRAARRVFDEADRVLGFSLTEIIFNGAESELQKTEITQPAVLATSVAVYRVVTEEGGRPEAVAGLSLGEYSALVAAEAFTLEQALPLVQKRGRYMQEAVPRGKGGMAAIIGLQREEVEDICRRAASGGVVEPSNYNCPGQVVISGEAETVKEAARLAREAGAKRAVELKVSAPFHCSLLRPVEEKMARELDRLELKPARIPVVANVSAEFVTEPEQVRKALVKQVSHPVRWEDSIKMLLGRGYDFFLELGPGKVLTGFMKKISREVYAAQVDSAPSLEKVREDLRAP